MKLRGSCSQLRFGELRLLGCSRRFRSGQLGRLGRHGARKWRVESVEKTEGGSWVSVFCLQRKNTGGNSERRARRGEGGGQRSINMVRGNEVPRRWAAAQLSLNEWETTRRRGGGAQWAADEILLNRSTKRLTAPAPASTQTTARVAPCRRPRRRRRPPIHATIGRTSSVLEEWEWEASGCRPLHHSGAGRSSS